ncbi:hypothetical protein H5P28_15045 [Ruficoccus amylovorans]|uniref:PEP-CTERM sorting domain-containing protein n=1 Tax=Ruficoccus amylovorans TaxID=1804625 RepID=A0A842HGN4_9BACT|nr:hypothetical protein [Ruficoccus amylovorans]MBC2595582.1 hypothetical protein [Ruficoccus amylovorans]
MKNTSFKKCSKVRAGIAAFAFSLSMIAVPVTSSAAIIFYQGFDYGSTAGELSAVSGGEWSEQATRPAAYETESLTYPGIESTGGSVLTDSGWSSSRTSTTQTLNIDISSKSEIWVSVLLSISTATPGTSNSAEIALRVLQNDWQSAVTRSVGKTYNNDSGYMSGTTALNGGSFAEVGTSVVQVVYRLAEGSAAEFWVNPDGTPVVGEGQLIGNNIANLTTIETLTISSQGLGMRMDEFIVADSYADIVVPEPGHIAVIGGVVVLLLTALRRSFRRTRA